MSIDKFLEEVYVIHSPHLSPARKSVVMKRLRNIGVSVPKVVSSVIIEKNDERLRNGFRSPGELSLIDTNILCIIDAMSRNLSHYAIVEDDIIIRKDFTEVWRSVESELKNKKWGIATPYRWPGGDKVIVKENIFTKPRLFNIMDQTNNQMIIVRGCASQDLKESYEHCIKKGWPLDFFYGYFCEEI